MNKKVALEHVEKFVREKMSGEGTGHDWWHIVRVRGMAEKIAKKEKNGDLFIIQLGAMLHDIADWKFHDGDFTKGSKVTHEVLKKFDMPDNIIEAVGHIVEEVSFKGAGVKNKMQSIEGKIVQDADRLDAMGAMGISRVFAFGGSKGNEIHNPTKKYLYHKTFEEYKKSMGGTSINHFYEKLLLIKDMMNTKTARQIALKRHKFMEKYLKQFYDEWETKI